jgi:hypothetical protein
MLISCWAVLILVLTPKAVAWTPGVATGLLLEEVSRQEFLISSSATALLFSLLPARSGVDVGGGVDLLARPVLSKPDVPFPLSMQGVWTCQRVVMAVEGDSFQAQMAWRALGGGKLLLQTPEKLYSTRFVPSKKLTEESSDAFVVMDRGFDVASRTGSTFVDFNLDEPNKLVFLEGKYNNKIQLDIVRRVVEVPSDQGFGFQELVRIDDGSNVRAALVKRRYRRAFDENQNRLVEGLEIVKTFRVLDGVAGTEFPTSTVKSQIRLMRPQSDSYDVPSEAF